MTMRLKAATADQIGQHDAAYAFRARPVSCYERKARCPSYPKGGDGVVRRIL